jgi:hypothetical protein
MVTKTVTKTVTNTILKILVMVMIIIGCIYVYKNTSNIDNFTEPKDIYIEKDNNKHKIKIIQASPPHTASTVLVNYLHGYLTPDEPIHFNDDKYLIMKTHNVNIDKLMKKNSDYVCYFVVSERNDSKEKSMINQKYKDYDNVLIINYNEIKDTTNDKLLNNITDNLFNKFKQFLPINTFNIEEQIKKNMNDRIKNMNKRYEEIKNKPFSYHDNFYHIHGHHKKRN